MYMRQLTLNQNQDCLLQLTVLLYLMKYIRHTKSGFFSKYSIKSSKIGALFAEIHCLSRMKSFVNITSASELAKPSCHIKPISPHCLSLFVSALQCRLQNIRLPCDLYTVIKRLIRNHEMLVCLCNEVTKYGTHLFSLNFKC